MDEAQYLANRVAVIAKGRIVAEGTPDRSPAATTCGRGSGSGCRATRPSSPRGARHRGRTARSSWPQTTPRRPCTEITSWALERGTSLRRPGGHAADPRGRVHRAHRRRGGPRVSTLGQVTRQLRFTNKAFWRNPASAFFTFAFPLMFLVIFTSMLGGGETLIAGVDLETSTYYVGAMAAFAVITACFTNIAISAVFARDSGELKRLRGTPLPACLVPRRAGAPRDARGRTARGDHDRVRAPGLRCPTSHRWAVGGVRRDVPRRVPVVRAR